MHAVGNYTFDDAVAFCEKNSSCAAFTVNGNLSAAKQDGTTPLPTYFKEVVARNTDPAWQTYVKADGPATKPTNAATVLRGALVYSLQLVEDFSVVKEWEPFLNKDFDITTTSTWNYALADLDIAAPESTLVRVSRSSLVCVLLVWQPRCLAVRLGLTKDVLAVRNDTCVLVLWRLHRNLSEQVLLAQFRSTLLAIRRLSTHKSKYAMVPRF